MAEPHKPPPCTFAFVMITTLFFMWGFVHNLDPILIPHLKKAFSLSLLQSSMIDSAVFLAYFCMALPAGCLIRKTGFKNTIVLGLLLFSCGCFLFIPAANTRQYAVFLGALFIIACGLAMLETAANPYAALLGAPERASQRLNLAQSFNGLAATLAPMIGARMILVQGASEQELQAMPAAARQLALAAEAASVKMPYLVLGCAVLLIAAIFYRLHLPSPGAAHTGAHPARSGIAQAWRHGAVRRAVIAQFFYVGAQVSVFSFFILYAGKAAGLSSVAAADYLGWGCGAAFMVGRFAGTGFMTVIPPARLLLLYAIACIALSAVAMLGSGLLAVGAVIGIAFFMSIMYPTIFSLGIKDAGADTEMASSLLVMSIIGGALLPLLFGAISDATGNIQYGYAVPLLCFMVTAWFARSSLAQRAAATSSPISLQGSTT